MVLVLPQLPFSPPPRILLCTTGAGTRATVSVARRFPCVRDAFATSHPCVCAGLSLGCAIGLLALSPPPTSSNQQQGCDDSVASTLTKPHSLVSHNSTARWGLALWQGRRPWTWHAL